MKRPASSVRRPVRSALASVALAGVASGLAPARDAQAQCSYEVLAVVVGEPCFFGGTKNLNLRAVNSSLFAVGYQSECPNVSSIPVTWSPETGVVHHTPPVLSPKSNYLLDVNEDGVAVGVFQWPGDDFALGVVLDGDEWTYLDSSPPGGRCNAKFITDAGVVVGERDVEVRPGETVRAVFRWTAEGGFEDLVGEPLAGRRTAVGVTADGTVLGYEGLNNSPFWGDIVPFFWHPDGTVTEPDLPPRDKEDRTLIGRMNDLGEFVLVIHRADGSVEIGIMTDTGFIPTETAAAEGDLAASVVVTELDNFGLMTGRTIYHTVPSPFYRSAPLGYRHGETVRLRERIIETEAPRYGTVPFSGPTATAAEAVDIGPGGLLVVAADLDFGLTSLILQPTERPVGDLNGDCRVTDADVRRLLERWGRKPLIADLDGDGEVGFGDLLILLTNWG